MGLDWRAAVVGLAMGVGGAWLITPHGWHGGDKDRPWALPDYQFIRDDPDGMVNITGTLMGEGVGYATNTWNIQCVRSDKVCHTANVEEIGTDQLGEIRRDDMSVESWTGHMILARSGAGLASDCSKVSLTINLDARTVAYTTVPLNPNLARCKRFGADRVYDWRIGDPPKPWEKPA